MFKRGNLMLFKVFLNYKWSWNPEHGQCPKRSRYDDVPQCFTALCSLTFSCVLTKLQQGHNVHMCVVLERIWKAAAEQLLACPCTKDSAEDSQVISLYLKCLYDLKAKTEILKTPTCFNELFLGNLWLTWKLIALFSLLFILLCLF